MLNSTRRLARQTVLTLSQAITRYLSEVSVHKKGHVSEQSIARIWLATRLAGRPVDRIRNTDLIEIRDEWTEAGKAPATVVRRLAFLSHVYTVIRKDWGQDQLANPVQLVRRPEVDNARDRRFFENIRLRGISEQECPKEEIEWILRNTKSAELPTILRLAKETGMRRSEIVYMRREHVDLRRGIVYVPHTKSGRPRNVPLTPFARDILRRWLSDKPGKGRIFTIKPGSVTRAFIRARKRARRAYETLCRRHNRRPNPDYFQNLHFHDARHEALSMLSPVYPTHEFAKVSGHADTRMLLRYVHPEPSYLARRLMNSPLGRRQTLILRQKQLALELAFDHCDVSPAGGTHAPFSQVAPAAGGAMFVSHAGSAPAPT
ncbi:tyrosine-type recombinase/integrase [Achromobacter aloeverae]